MAAQDAEKNEQSDASVDEDLINVLGRSGRRRSDLIYSFHPRPLVPSDSSQDLHATYITAARQGRKVEIHAPPCCPTCSAPRPSNVPVRRLMGVIEFGTGSVESLVMQWWCHKCKRGCIVDGLAHGIVMCSQFTAYTEVFLFEAGVNLCRISSFITSIYDLHACFHQLSKHHSLPLSLSRLRSLRLFRSTVLLYIYLFQEIAGEVSTCAVCARADGSLLFVCFEGLQLGFKLRHRSAFERIAGKRKPIRRASIMAQTASDVAVAKALGSILSVATIEHENARQKAVQTLTAVRGPVMALAVLYGDTVPGEEGNMAGTTPHASGVSRSRGWDLVMDGGVFPAVHDFIRELFFCGRASRKVAWTVAGASEKLRRKIPAVLMARVNDVIARGAGGESSDTEYLEDSSGEQRAQPLVSSLSRAVGDPGLLDAGGVAGQQRRDNALMRVIPSIPATTAKTSHLIEFIRAVVVDPAVVWAPSGDWAGVQALVAAMSAETFKQSSLDAAGRSDAVKTQRLLHGAVLTIYPVLCSQPRVRELLRNVLLEICETNERYLRFVIDDVVEQLPGANGQVLAASVEDMAVNCALKAYHPLEYTKR